MEIQPDFRDLLKLFTDHRVEFIIVGGYALAFHGAPRFTGDLDLLIRPSPSNAKKVLSALAEFGFTFPNLTLDDFQKPNNVVQLGLPPIRIDLITSISGVSWEDADAHKEAGMYGEISVCYLGRKEFIKNKIASGRHKDLADLEALGCANIPI
jgi:hypothetical protein